MLSLNRVEHVGTQGISFVSSYSQVLILIMKVRQKKNISTPHSRISIFLFKVVIIIPP